VFSPISIIGTRVSVNRNDAQCRLADIERVDGPVGGRSEISSDRVYDARNAAPHVDPAIYRQPGPDDLGAQLSKCGTKGPDLATSPTSVLLSCR
jgi:hypothetical protein